MNLIRHSYFAEVTTAPNKDASRLMHGRRQNTNRQSKNIILAFASRAKKTMETQSMESD